MAPSTPSRQVLEETPARALTFLRAVGTKRDVRTLLFAHGYSQEEQERGWALLHDACGIGAVSTHVVTRPPALEAGAEIDRWATTGFRRVSAALGRLHPAQKEFVFRGVTARKSARTVLDLSVLLGRLDQLEASREKADRAAIATLSARGITRNERARLKGLVKRLVIAPSLPAPPAATEAEVKAQKQSLLALRDWYVDWAETARAIVSRRDHRIALGIARRRKTGTVEEG